MFRGSAIDSIGQDGCDGDDARLEGIDEGRAAGCLNQLGEQSVGVGEEGRHIDSQQKSKDKTVDFQTYFLWSHLVHCPVGLEKQEDQETVTDHDHNLANGIGRIMNITEDKDRPKEHEDNAERGHHNNKEFDDGVKLDRQDAADEESEAKQDPQDG
jgi:hypothetical protein